MRSPSGGAPHRHPDRMAEAAPDLLASLKALLSCPDLADLDPEDVDPATREAERLARSAITKATGVTGQ